MRRSEMIDWLAKIVKQYDVLDKTAAEEILEGIEQLGMLPPGYAKYYDAKPTDFVFVNEWEPENE